MLGKHLAPARLVMSSYSTCMGNIASYLCEGGKPTGNMAPNPSGMNCLLLAPAKQMGLPPEGWQPLQTGFSDSS